ncbi:MAG TPA: MFS transporter [Thermoanaerobaculia bacterium]|nr:MFS transporter [Thermoanaerobaculia bacterium]
MAISAYASLRVADFRRLLLANGTLTVAREAQIVVVGWQVFELTRDPLTLGLVGLAEALPFIAVALYAGHVADRSTRRTVALAGTFGLLLSAVALLLLTLTPGAITATRVWPVYVIIALGATARSFMRPAVFALSAEVLPRELYPNAVAWRTSTWHLAAVAGPAAGGLIYGFSGPALAYGCVIGAMALAMAVVASVTHRARPPMLEELPIGESLESGIRFVMSEQVLLAAMTLDLFAVLFGGAVALLPAFATMLSAGPEGLGILRAAPAIGSIVTGLVIAHRPPMRNAGLAIFASVAAFGVCMLGFALSRSFWLSFAFLVASGVADNVSVVIRSTLLQTRTPDHLLGRVSAVNQIFIGSSNEIGAFESGVAARLLGVVPSVIFGGCMTLLVVVLVAWRAPELRRLKSLEH